MATLFNWGVFASKHRVSKFEDGGKIFDCSLCQLLSLSKGSSVLIIALG
jgi:hypothetical protein